MWREVKTVRVRVSFTDDRGNAETLISGPTATVAARPNREATGTPTISGTLQVDETLTVDNSGIGDADGLVSVIYSYQWVRVDGGIDSDIEDATGSTYTLVEADAGKAIRVRVRFADDRGHAETLTSGPTASVAARPNSAVTGVPTIGGTARVGETFSMGGAVQPTAPSRPELRPSLRF